MKIIEKKIVAESIKYDVPKSWSGKFDAKYSLRDLTDLLSFIDKNTGRRGTNYDSLADFIDDIPSCDLDVRGFEIDSEYGYVVRFDDSKREIECESLSEAIEHCIGGIPDRDPIYYCTGNKISLVTSIFSEVVEFYYINYKDFECNALNDDERQYLEQLRYYVFSTIMSK
jgi:hypothetical protein